MIGYIVCTYFFSNLASKVSGLGGTLIQVLILLVFGLLLFYATRVGEGKQVKRFSLPVLLLVDVPCLYIIAAALIKALPLHDQLAPVNGSFPFILILATVALGYGIPYTFLSGYELDRSETENAAVSDAMQEKADSSAVTSPENKTSDSNNEENTIDESAD